jgi:hypothetical protein
MLRKGYFGWVRQNHQKRLRITFLGRGSVEGLWGLKRLILDKVESEWLTLNCCLGTRKSTTYFANYVANTKENKGEKRKNKSEWFTLKGAL